MSNLTVIGCGAWGGTIAKVLAENGHKVSIWCHSRTISDSFNRQFTLDILPNISFPKTIRATDSLEDALTDSEGVILGVASQFLNIIRDIQAVLNQPLPMLSLTKGLLNQSGYLFISDYIRDVLGESYPLVFLSGPNLAKEIALGKPAATVIASTNDGAALCFQQYLSSKNLRVYTQTDVRGVELGGVLKNVYAIAAGLMDGYELGENAKAAMVARALQEMIRFGAVFGAKKDTFYGLSGVGDLVATCSSTSSRNWRVGMALAEHGDLDRAIDSLGSISEGVKTARFLHKISSEKLIDMPIASEVYKVLYENQSVENAVNILMGRPLKPE